MSRPLLAIALLALFAHVAVAQPQALPPEQLKKIKAATVFVKVAFGNLEGSGSGFVVHATKDYGIIVTNQHVIAPPERRPQGGRFPPPPPFGGGAIGGNANVEVVFNSGTQTEWSVKAEIIYEHKQDDLALLKVRALKPIPEPLALTGADKLPETTPVFVCGFPFGDALAAGNKNPEISIGPASVSSNRTDDRGNVVMVQLNGALNPGNSGGPVISQDGKLVGVAVQTITGAGIGFAVPPAMVRKAIDEVHFADPIVTWPGENPRRMRLNMKLVDALSRLKGLELHIAPAPNTTVPSEVAKLANASVVVPTITPATGTVVANFDQPTGRYFWMQIVWTNIDGNVTRNPAMRFATDARNAGPITTKSIPRPVTPSPAPSGSAEAELDGKPLPPLARRLMATPNGQMDVDELNARAKELRGRDLVIDILTTGSSSGWGDGPSLSGYNRNRRMPANLDFVISRPLADAYTSLNLQGFVAVRLRGKVQPSASGKVWELFVVDEIGLLGTDGNIVGTLSRANASAIVNTPPRAVPQPRATPEAVRPPVQPNMEPRVPEAVGGVPNPPPQAEIVPNPDAMKVRPPNAPGGVPVQAEEESSNTPIFIGAGIGVFVVICGLVTWAVIASKKPQQSSRSGRTRSRDSERRRPPVARRAREDDDEDDEEDERPRRRSRRDD